MSYGTSTKTEYDIGSGVTDYNDTPFTVVKDTNMTVTAVDCDGVLCSGISTVTKTITHAAAPTVNITINDENGAVSLSPSVDATETTYDIGSGYVAYTSSFTPADGTVVNASARNCSTDLCSLAGTDSLTVTYDDGSTASGSFEACFHSASTLLFLSASSLFFLSASSLLFQYLVYTDVK